MTLKFKHRALAKGSQLKEQVEAEMASTCPLADHVNAGHKNISFTIVGILCASGDQANS